MCMILTGQLLNFLCRKFTLYQVQGRAPIQNILWWKKLLAMIIVLYMEIINIINNFIMNLINQNLVSLWSQESHQTSSERTTMLLRQRRQKIRNKTNQKIQFSKKPRFYDSDHWENQESQIKKRNIKIFKDIGHWEDHQLTKKRSLTKISATKKIIHRFLLTRWTGTCL